MTKSYDNTLKELADRQFGLLTTQQLIVAGFGPNDLTGLCERGWLQRVQRGVYRLAGSPRTWRGGAMATVLSVGGDAVISHYSAGVLWGLVDPVDLNGAIHVTASRLVRRRAVVDHRHLVLPGERALRFGIPTTGIERTILDIAEAEPVSRVGLVIDEAIRQQRTTTIRLAETVERHRRRGHRRLGSIRDALALRGAGYDPGANDWERQMDEMWDRMGLPPAERQATIILPGGRRVRPDRVVWEAKLAVEWNGFAWHGLRSDFESDIERRNLLQRAGWTVIEFHSRQTPSEIAQTVREVYDRLCSAIVPAS